MLIRVYKVQGINWWRTKTIEPNIPPPARTGRPRNDDRRTINVMLCILIACCKKINMPQRYGSCKSVW